MAISKSLYPVYPDCVFHVAKVIRYAITMVLCRGDGVLQSFISSRDAKGLYDCIKKGFKVNQINKYGETPLYVASYYGEESIVDFLMENGANPNICNCDGDTPLHAASLGGFCSILEKLILNGGDLRLANYNGQRARDLLTYSECAPETIDSLIRHYFDMAEYISCGGNVDGVRQTFNEKQNNSRRSKSKFMYMCSDSQEDCKGKKCGRGSQNCIIHTGFGTFACRNNKALGYSTHVPIINNEIDLKPDRGAVDVYCNGAFTEIVSMQWRGTPVSVKRVDAQAILNDDCDAQIIGLLLNQPLREIEFMSYLRHPNILTLMAVSPTYYPQNSDISLSMVFERAHLGSLYHHLHVKLEEMSLLSCLTIMRQIAEAVIFLHDSNLVHCALTSHAIHLIAPDFAKLGNLEYAIEWDCSSRSTPNKEKVYTSSKYSCSLPARNTLPQAVYNWLAPELFKSDVPISAATDVYSMGVLVWETLTGILPHKQSLPDEIFRNWTPAVSPSSVDCETVPAGLRSSLRGSQHHHPKARITLEQLYQALVSTFWNEHDRYTYSPRLSNLSKQELSYERNESRASQETLMNISPVKKPKVRQYPDTITTQAVVHHAPQHHALSQKNILSHQTNNSNSRLSAQQESTAYRNSNAKVKNAHNVVTTNPRGNQQQQQKNVKLPDRKIVVDVRSADNSSESELWVTTLDESDVMTITSRKKLERQISSVSSSSSIQPTTTTTNNEDSPTRRQSVKGKPPINISNTERVPSLKQSRFNREDYKQFAAVPNHSGNGRQARATYPRRRDTIDNCAPGYCSTTSSRSRHSSEDDHRVKPASHRTSVSPPRAALRSDSMSRPIDLIKVSSRGMRSPSPPFLTLRSTREDPAWQRHKPSVSSSRKTNRSGSVHSPVESRDDNFEEMTASKFSGASQTRMRERGEVVEEHLAKVKTLVSSFEDLDRQSFEGKHSYYNSTRRSFDPDRRLNRTASLSPIMHDNKFVGAINTVLQSKQATINRDVHFESEKIQKTVIPKSAASTNRIDFKAVQEKWKRSTNEKENKLSTKKEAEFQTAREIYKEDAMKAGFTSANQLLRHTLKSGSAVARASFNTAKELYDRVSKKSQALLECDVIAKKAPLLSIGNDGPVDSPEMTSTPVYANAHNAEEYRYVSSSSGPENMNQEPASESKSDNDERWTTAIVESIDLNSGSMINDSTESQHKSSDVLIKESVCIEAISHSSTDYRDDPFESHGLPEILHDSAPKIRNKSQHNTEKLDRNLPFLSSSEANISDAEPRTVIKKSLPQWFHRRQTRRITKIRSRPFSANNFDSGSGGNTWDEIDPSDVWSDDERWREALYSENFWEDGVKWPDSLDRNNSLFARSDYHSCDNVFNASGSLNKSGSSSDIRSSNNCKRNQPFRDLKQLHLDNRMHETHSDARAKLRLKYSQENLSSHFKENRENRPHFSGNASPNSGHGPPSAQFVTPNSEASDEEWGF